MLERRARQRGPAVGALAVTAARADAAGRRRARPRPSGAASTRPGRAAAAGSTCGGASGPRPASAGRWRRTGPTRSCSSSTRSRSRVASALILVVMLDVISGGAKPEYRAFVVVGSALCGRSSWRASRGLAWIDPRRPRALPDAQVRLRQPERLPGRAARPRRRPDRRRRRWGRSITLAVGVLLLGVPFDLGARRLAAPRRRDGPRRSRRSSRSACCSPRSASRPARSRGRTRRRSAGALFLVSGAVFPLVGPAVAGPGDRPADAADAGGSRASAQALFPGGIAVDRRARLAVRRR